MGAALQGDTTTRAKTDDDFVVGASLGGEVDDVFFERAYNRNRARCVLQFADVGKVKDWLNVVERVSVFFALSSCEGVALQAASENASAAEKEIHSMARWDNGNIVTLPLFKPLKLALINVCAALTTARR